MHSKRCVACLSLNNAAFVDSVVICRLTMHMCAISTLGSTAVPRRVMWLILSTAVERSVMCPILSTAVERRVHMTCNRAAVERSVTWTLLITAVQLSIVLMITSTAAQLHVEHDSSPCVFSATFLCGLYCLLSALLPQSLFFPTSSHCSLPPCLFSFVKSFALCESYPLLSSFIFLYPHNLFE